MTKGFIKDKKFHPISNYTSVKRKKREPFKVTKDGVKISQKELVQMGRADIGRRKKIKSVLEEQKLQPEIVKVRDRIISDGKKLAKSKDSMEIIDLVSNIEDLEMEHKSLIMKRNKALFGDTTPSQALIPYVLPKVNSDGSDAFFINIFDAFRRGEEEELPFFFNNVTGEIIEVPNRRRIIVGN